MIRQLARVTDLYISRIFANTNAAAAAGSIAALILIGAIFDQPASLAACGKM